ncbi:hypothetical protein TSAR_004603 [Trichomalopsis sarcophagae]|uniref:Peptidase S1 domain-containing protein n=1 Tax=Trichomalopsis sarcophagae TaxID=543379 RepID=A0A232EEV7_9HYME|nr:hypothetical protein TSAR_004603 [Trichomalopsis sarcophagae]
MPRLGRDHIKLSVSGLQIVVGTVNLKLPYQIYKASKIIVNRQFSSKDSFKNDIALIKVSRRIRFSNRVKAVRLPELHLRLRPHTPVIVSGWGRLLNGTVANILQEVLLEVTDQGKCRRAVAKKEFNLYYTQMCADDNDDSIMSGDCNEQGDSGGPLTTTSGILVVGHCGFNQTEQIQAVVGCTDLDAPKTVHIVTKIYVHERFKAPRHLANDIALMKVDTPFKFDNLISPVVLPKSHEIVKINEKALVSGWGSMKGVEVSIVDQEYCRNLYNNSVKREIYPEQLCTHEIGERRKGVCAGDSGGPVTIHKNILIGIISWSSKDPDCASPLYPDVHVRVSEYLDWINKHVKKM